MTARRQLALAVAAGLALASAPARAEDGTSRDPAPQTRTDRRYMLVTLETLGALGIGTIWYWVNTDLNSEDWELHWDAESWRQKLFSFEAIRFDTNEFYINAVRHPFGGVVRYQIGRANGFGVGGATVIGLIGTMFWEYIIEFKEYISVNDIIVDTIAGVAIGEPMFQVGRFTQDEHGGWGQRTLGMALSPFDGLHEWANAGSWTSNGRRWHRFRLLTGARAATFEGDVDRGEGLIGLDLELVGQRGYGRPGRRSSWSYPGAWSHLEATVHFAPESADELATATRVESQTTLWGHYRQDVHATAGGGRRGWGLFLGTNTAFLYDTRRLPKEWDRLGVVSAGPSMELALYGGRATWRWQLGAYGDFGMVQAHVFGPKPPFTPSKPATSVLRAQGYYFGSGVTLLSRMDVSTDVWHAELDVRAERFWSIDGLDRHELNGGPEDPHDVSDDRLYGRLAVGLRPGDAPVIVDAVLGTRLMRGTWQDVERRSWELETGVRVGLLF